MNTPNPYAPPPSAPPSPRSGDNGDFAIGEVLAEAWRLSDGCKASFLALYVALLGVLWLMQMLVAILFGFDGSLRAAPFKGLLWQLLLAGAMYPFLAGVMRLALRRADGLPVEIADAWTHGVRLGEVILLGVLVTVATTIGFALLLLPGVYLSVALMFALLLVVDRRLGAVAAMKASIGAVHPRWFHCAGLLFVLGMLLALGGLVIVGLIWVLPVSSIALALVYRRFFPAIDPARTSVVT